MIAYTDYPFYHPDIFTHTEVRKVELSRYDGDNVEVIYKDIYYKVKAEYLYEDQYLINLVSKNKLSKLDKINYKSLRY